MERMACVNVPALPLQIVLDTHRDWAELPVVVVDHDKPMGIIQWVNRAARTCRILPGMRYAMGLSLSQDLRAATVSQAEIGDTINTLTHALWNYTPRIEPSTSEPGIFWLGASGLHRLYPSLEDWAGRVQDELKAAGFYASIAVGFSRFGSYATAKSRRAVIVFQSDEEERAYLRDVPIERLDIEPSLRDTLAKLGIRTLGEFVALPASGIRKRFGAEAHALHSMAAEDGWDCLDPVLVLDPPEATTELDYPETNAERLGRIIRPLLKDVVTELARRHELLAALTITLVQNDHTRHVEDLAPAAATRDLDQLMTLVQLRLDTLSLGAGVVELWVRGHGVKAASEQLTLFPEGTERDVQAVHRAFAALRAEFGNNAVVQACTHERHLPEGCFTWEPMTRLAPPKPDRHAGQGLVRRILTPAKQLPSRARREPDGWLLAGLDDGPVEEVLGPHIVCGGWWRQEQETERAYYYVRTKSGRWLWIYHDQRQRKWFLQGEVQ